ncbi:MAG: Shedu anti-phage system protein SduA domain-containing protein, partial [Dolichospermum sp.]
MTLKQLYNSLTELIEKPNQREDWYQNWFESNPEIFTILGLSSPLSHPYYVSLDGETYIPDFLVKDRTGNWLIFELKRPDTKVHKNVNRRQDFYSDFSSYLAQCNEYSAYFEEVQNRNFLKEKYRIDVQKQVQSIIVVSRDINVDKRWVHDEILRNRNARTILWTFDDILAAISSQISLQESSFVNLKGLSGAILFAHLDSMITPEDQYLLDFGRDIKNRISIGFNRNSIFVEVTSNGVPISTRKPFLFSLYQKPIILYFEVGLSDSQTHIALSINFTDFIFRTFDPMRIKLEDIYNWVIGSDVTMKTPASSIMYEQILYNCMLKHEEQQQLFSYFKERYTYYFSPLSIHPLPGIVFQGKKC